MLFNEPEAANEETPSTVLRTIKGRGAKDIGAYIEAIENLPA